jgi:hypothetical protein
MLFSSLASHSSLQKINGSHGVHESIAINQFSRWTTTTTTTTIINQCWSQNGELYNIIFKYFFTCILYKPFIALSFIFIKKKLITLSFPFHTSNQKSGADNYDDAPIGTQKKKHFCMHLYTINNHIIILFVFSRSNLVFSSFCHQIYCLS